MGLTSAVVPSNIRFPRRGRRKPTRPVWSAWWVTLLGMLFVVAVSVPSLIAGDRTPRERGAWILALVAIGLWTMLFAGLYCGVRVRRTESLPRPEPASPGRSWGGSDLGPIDLDFDLGGVDHPVAGVILFLLWLALSIGLVFCAPMIFDGLLYAIIGLVAALAWVARRALRQVFVRGPRCRERLGRSLAYATVFTAIYTGWLFGLLLAIRR